MGQVAKAVGAASAIDYAKQSQFGRSGAKREVLFGTRVMMSWTRRQARKNKANSGHQADREIGVPGGQSVQNEPNPGRPAWCPRGNCAKQTQSRRVGRQVEYPSFNYPILPVLQAQSDRAKQSQFAGGVGRTRPCYQSRGLWWGKPHPTTRTTSRPPPSRGNT